MIRAILFTACFFWVSLRVFGQVHTTAAGDVGVGTTSPAKKFHVNGDVRMQRPSSGGLSYIDIFTNSNSANIHSDDPGSAQKSLIISVAPTSTSGTDRHIYFKAGKVSGTLQTRMVVRGNGNVGIGVETPTYRLEVVGNSKWIGHGSSFTEVNSNSNGQYLRQYGLDGISESWLIRGYAGSDGVQAYFKDGGINVNGTVKSKEVNVTTAGWADHVFEEDYNLRPLSQVRDFYRENKHLPDIPTEREVLENGVNLSEMTVKLLEKVEELTIYLVQQQDRIGELEKEVARLKSDGRK